MIVDRSFGEWLRQRRRTLDLTQEELAKQVGCSAITLRKIEAEERRPSKQIAERLAAALQVARDEQSAFLRFARGDPFAAPEIAKAPTASELRQAPRHNLPLQLTSFIGREQELTEIKQLLDPLRGAPAAAALDVSTQEGVRLLTLTGPGGTGKTRLAIQVAVALLAAFPDGAWWVELAPLADPGLIPQAVASVLDVGEEPDRPLLATLTDHLSRKRALLILDNCEHLIQACARFAEVVLRACPQVRLLASSRELLGVSGERAFPVPSLRTPTPNDALLPDRLRQCESVRLFLDRAAATAPQIVLTPANAGAVAQVCQRLDGIPLALELAAAKVRMLPVEQLAARLDDAFRLLTGGSRTALPRHQTLQALIDWSYDLLPPAEQRLLRQLSVFAGGCTLEAAEAVCAGEVLEQSAVAERLGRLIDKSLVQATEQDGVARYRLMATLRQYAQARLAASGEADDVRRGHAEYYWALAMKGAPGAAAPSQVWLDQVRPELDNMRAALDWSQLAPGRVKLALSLGAILAILRCYYRYGSASEAQGWLERALAQPEAANYPGEQALAILELGGVLTCQGDYQAAEEKYAQGLELYEALGDRLSSAWVLFWLAFVPMNQGDVPAAETQFTLCLRLFRELGDRQGSASALERLGWAARERGDGATACARLKESLTLCRELGDQTAICDATMTLAEAMSMQGDLAAAKAMLEENLVQARQLAYPNGIGWSLNHLGHVAQLEGDDEQAIQLHEASLPVFSQWGTRNWGLVEAFQSLGETVLAQHKARTAAAHFAKALAMARDIGNREALAWCLAGLAGAAVLDEEPERAAWLWGASEKLRLSLGVREAPCSHATHERLKAQTRQQLGEPAFRAEWEAGEAAPLSEAIERALS